MSNAEKYISDCTRNCSNELIAFESRAGKEVISYNEWLTPDQARKAVEIAREEMIEKGIEFLKDHLEGFDIFGSDIEKSVESFKLAMKYE